MHCSANIIQGAAILATLINDVPAPQDASERILLTFTMKHFDWKKDNPFRRLSSTLRLRPEGRLSAFFRTSTPLRATTADPTTFPE